MIEIRFGITSKQELSQKLVDQISRLKDLDGILYIGYPILFAAGKSQTIDALLVTREKGAIVFDIHEEESLDELSEDHQDYLYNKLVSLFANYPALNKRRDSLVSIDVISFVKSTVDLSNFDVKIAKDLKTLQAALDECEDWNYPEKYETVISVIQNVIHLKADKKRDNVTAPTSRGGKLVNLEKEISNLDSEQEKAVIEFFDGIHRIRGLAGSGKTIVLALKAAYLHTQHPTWDIAVTFYSRALKPQFIELIERFCIEKKGEKPNWKKIRIIQSWGGKTVGEGMYKLYCDTNNIQFLDVSMAKSYRISKSLFGMHDFEAICDKALKETKTPSKRIFDAILVDEAQDLSDSFLKLCFGLLRDPKRLIYAYDELQKLDQGPTLSAPKEIFGREAKDTILYKCYRNSRPVLVTAHALGFGIYRDKGLVQFFDAPLHWQDVGYEVSSGSLSENSKVTLERGNKSSPEYLEQHSSGDDLILFKKFDTVQQQLEWVAEQIKINLDEDELTHKDIVIINPEISTSKTALAKLKSYLFESEILVHKAGDIDADVFFQDDSIAYTSINRAKGNEAPMVYVINSEFCYTGEGAKGDLNLTKYRNTLFTSLTRSKSWVRVLGVGDQMAKLVEEFEQVKKHDFKLTFRYPTKEEIQRINLIHRDLSPVEEQKIKDTVNATKHLMNIIEDINEGRAVIENYPEEMQLVLSKLL